MLSRTSFVLCSINLQDCNTANRQALGTFCSGDTPLGWWHVFLAEVHGNRRPPKLPSVTILSVLLLSPAAPPRTAGRHSAASVVSVPASGASPAGSSCPVPVRHHPVPSAPAVAGAAGALCAGRRSGPAVPAVGAGGSLLSRLRGPRCAPSPPGAALPRAVLSGFRRACWALGPAPAARSCARGSSPRRLRGAASRAVPVPRRGAAAAPPLPGLCRPLAVLRPSCRGEGAGRGAEGRCRPRGLARVLAAGNAAVLEQPAGAALPRSGREAPGGPRAKWPCTFRVLLHGSRSHFDLPLKIRVSVSDCRAEKPPA